MMEPFFLAVSTSWVSCSRVAAAPVGLFGEQKKMRSVGCEGGAGMAAVAAPRHDAARFESHRGGPHLGLGEVGEEVVLGIAGEVLDAVEARGGGVVALGHPQDDRRVDVHGVRGVLDCARGMLTALSNRGTCQKCLARR